MGTKARVVLYAADAVSAQAAAAAAFARIAQLDASLSDYRRDSELSVLAAQAGSVPVPIGQDLYTILRYALALSEETDGAFDVTAGPLVAQWRRARRTGRLPEAPALDDARERVGWRYLLLDTVKHTVLLARPGMSLDLGGIAKGYAADRALDTLRLHGVDRALVELGGEIVVGRAPPGSEGWRIELENADLAHHSMTLENVAISSSGNAEQFVDIDGVRYSHVIDPRTGKALTHHDAATVIARAGMMADAYATAVTVLDETQRTRFIAAHPEARFYLRNPTARSPS
jgi:thiamine biosynthesis lipoprotein